VGCSLLPGTTPGDLDPPNAWAFVAMRDAPDERAEWRSRTSANSPGWNSTVSVALKEARRRPPCPFPQQIGPIVGVSNFDPAGRRVLPQQ